MTDYRLWPATSGPAADSGDPSALWLAVEFYVTQAATLTAWHFWRATTNITGPWVTQLWQVNSASSGTAVTGTNMAFSSVAGTGWQDEPQTGTINLTPNQRYRGAVYFPHIYSATGAYWSTGAGASGLSNGPLAAPNATDATGNAQGSYILFGTPDPAYPTSTFNATNYWVDITVTVAATDLPPPPELVVPTQAIVRASFF